MNTFIRTSGTVQLNDVRKLLWESIYTNFSNMNSLVNHIRSTFIPHSIDTNFDFTNMTITLKSTGRPFDKEEAKQNLTNAYREFVKDMYTKGVINNYDYNLCTPMIENLFFITFTDNSTMNIHL
jgi:hypothetical protein|nr:MAG TPA: hypothetical protein [Caudoviricetes sp.]